jgi:MFS family permease
LAPKSLQIRLPRSIWLLESGGFVENFGTGLVFPFVVLYLHDVRHFSVATAGFFIALRGASGLGLAPLGGILADRLGARSVAVGSLLVAAAGWVALAEVSHPWQAYAVAILIGASNAGFWPAYSALLAELTPPELRHSAYNISNLLRNAGIGLGAVVGGLVASTAHPHTYTDLLLLNAGSFVVYALIALALPRGRVSQEGVTEEQPKAGYRRVLSDRGLLAIVTINASFIATFTAANYFVAPFLHDHAGVSERGIGIAWAINTAAIVALQLPIAGLMARRRYMVGLATAAGIWALSLLIIAAAGATLNGTVAVAAVSGAFLLYAVCDCLLTPSQGAIVAQLAPEHLRGRYMAVSSMSWEVGAFVGPAAAGLIYAAAPTAMWPIFAAFACLTGIAALGAERLLPKTAQQPALMQPD